MFWAGAGLAANKRKGKPRENPRIKKIAKVLLLFGSKSIETRGVFELENRDF
jgi:hypothetical protein